ncbi:MAG: multidrug transporter AcrB [Candidatus Aminicenantes bacterium RBG_16_63_16]|nr:MAG: multidrug transporter AcrB [Candidatus Aminicenantes bacterium RBG_16_63_16]
MIDKLILWSLRNRGLVLALTLGFLIWGGFMISTMPVDVLPDLTAPTVTILVEGHGMAPMEMESLVSFPIEAALNGAAGVRRVRSATAVGVAIIWVEFEWGEDIFRARQTVSEKLSMVAGTLPPEIERPALAPVSSIMGEIMFIALGSDRHSPLDLRTMADTTIRRRLLAIPGVSQVTPIGGGEKQYEVVVSSIKLLAHDVTLRDIEDALRHANSNTSAGFLVKGGQEYLIQGIGRISDLRGIGQTVVALKNGRPVVVDQLGEVQIGSALKRGEGSHNGEPAVILGIQKQPGANTLKLTRLLDAALDEIQAALPQGVTIEKHIFRQADFIETANHNLMAALRDGGILVILIVFLFLANFRASSITLLAIPLSLLAAVMVMKLAGATINSMTLGGLAIAVGAIVDDAIIDVENVFRRLRLNARQSLESRLPDRDVVFGASREIRSSIVFATLIIILVFLPMFFLSGVEGRLLRPLGLAYIVAIFASLIVALTVTPALCSYLLPRARAVIEGREARFVTWLKRGYERLLPGLLNRSTIILAGSVVLLIAAVVAIGRAGRAFLPEFNEGTLTISAVTLPGTSLQESDRMGRTVERILLGIPEVSATARRTGRAELDEHVQGVESAEIDVGLKMGKRSKAEMLADMRSRLSLVPGMNFTLGQPISHRIDHMLSGTRANIAVKIFGDDLQTLRDLAKEVQSSMRDVAGVVDLSTEQQMDIPTVRVRFDRAALARYGLPAGDAARSLQTAFVGEPVGQIFEGQVAFPLVLRYTRDNQADLESVRQTLVDTPSGIRIPLSAVADIRVDRSPNFISRENVQRKITVMCNVAGRDLKSVVDDVRRRVQASVRLPGNYHIEYGGQFESEAQASRVLLALGLAVILCILVILTAVFRSLSEALIIMFNLPLALIGGVVGVYLSGGILSIASIIGFITLFGIAVRNGIMLISHIKHLMEEEGVSDFRQAVLRGAVERLSPILMTALAAGLALIPLALGSEKPGSEIEAPMAVVILFGLLSSTLLNMIVVPVVFLRFGNRRRKG